MAKKTLTHEEKNEIKEVGKQLLKKDCKALAEQLNNFKTMHHKDLVGLGFGSNDATLLKKALQRHGF